MHLLSQPAAPRNMGPATSSYVRKGGSGASFPGPEFSQDSSPVTMSTGPIVLGARQGPPLAPPRDFRAEKAAQVANIDTSEDDANAVALPQAPSGYARSGPEGIAAGLAILGNLLDRHHQAGTAGYAAYRSGVAGAQNTAYQDALQEAQSKQQQAATRGSKAARQLRQIELDEQDAQKQGLGLGDINFPADPSQPNAGSTPTKLDVSYGKIGPAMPLSNVGFGPDPSSGTGPSMAGKQAAAIRTVSGYVDPQFYARAVAAYERLAKRGTNGLGPSSAEKLDALAQLWRIHHLTLSRLVDSTRDLTQTQMGPNEQRQFEGASAQIARIERHLMQEANQAGLLGDPSRHQAFWHSAVGIVVANIISRGRLATEPVQDVRSDFKRLTGHTPDF